MRLGSEAKYDSACEYSQCFSAASQEAISFSSKTW